ncbi:MAG: type II secretion system F family protein [Acidimicrobiales bacterium]
MKRSRVLGGVLLALLLAVLGPAPAAYADTALTMVATDVTGHPDVRLVVAVPEPLDVQSLTAGSFSVREGGQPRTVRVEALPADQLEVALVIDTSGSMVGAPLAAAKAAAQVFLAQLPPTVPVSVIGFGASPTVVSPRSTNRVAQVAGIRALTAGGQTALYDALGMALTQLPGGGARQMAVLLTDGGDTASSASLDATAEALGAAKVPLFAVELRTSESSPAALGRLTSASGGQVVPAADPAALAGAFDAVARQLVRQYSVAFRSEANGPTDLEVVVESRGVRATGRQRLDLPLAAISSPSTTLGAALTERNAGAPATGEWALFLGGGLCGVALLGLLLLYVTTRVPRARGLVRRRGMALADVADRADSVGASLIPHHHGVAVGKALELAGVDVRPGELLVAVAAAAMLVFGVAWFVFAPLVGLVLALLVFVTAAVVVRGLISRRRKKFSNQLADTLQILAGSLRAGHGLAQAIDTVTREAESPTAEEFKRLTIETRLGRDFVDALQSLADRVGSEDFQWVVQAVQIQREVGGDLAAILDSVAGTVRDRSRIRRQVSALSAEGRMSAWVLMILPFGLAGIMALTSRDYLNPLFATGTGLRLLAVAAVLLTVGGLWLRRIVKPIF